MSPLAIGVLLAWLALGVVVALALRSRGAGVETVVAAVVGWPLLVHQLFEGPARPAPPEAGPAGPLGTEIERAFAKVREVAPRGDADWLGDLEVLRASLLAADARVALVDRILAEAAEDRGSASVAASIAQLTARRARTLAEVEAVLAELVRMRVQIGIVALSGDTLPVRDGLLSLNARVRALDEMSRLEEL